MSVIVGIDEQVQMIGPHAVVHRRIWWIEVRDDWGLAVVGSASQIGA